MAATMRRSVSVSQRTIGGGRKERRSEPGVVAVRRAKRGVLYITVGRGEVERSACVGCGDKRKEVGRMWSVTGGGMRWDVLSRSCRQPGMGRKTEKNPDGPTTL